MSIEIVEGMGILQAGQVSRWLTPGGKERWLLACPNCGFVGALDHEVAIADGKPTITPPLDCPKCPAHYRVRHGGEVTAA